MAAETVSFTITSEILDILNLGSADLGQEIRLLAAIAYFQEKKLSLGEAAQLAGLRRVEFVDALSERGLHNKPGAPSELETVAQTETAAEISQPIERPSRGQLMVIALEQLAEHEAFEGVDPVTWQQNVRIERSLPGRK